MNTELNAYLDGEKTLDELSPAGRDEAEAWERMLAEVRPVDPVAAPPWLEHAVMSELSALPAHAPKKGVLAWLLRPRTIRVSPLTAGVVATALATLILLPGSPGGPDPVVGPVPSPGPAVTQVFVEFSLQAPGATSVAVAGDFSSWQAEFTLEDADGDGVWTGRVPMQPGVHKYMFVIDGTNWVTDPEADRYVDDGFGSRNAVLAVSPVTE